MEIRTLLHVIHPSLDSTWLVFPYIGAKHAAIALQGNSWWDITPFLKFTMIHTKNINHLMETLTVHSPSQRLFFLQLISCSCLLKILFAAHDYMQYVFLVYFLYIVSDFDKFVNHLKCDRRYLLQSHAMTVHQVLGSFLGDLTFTFSNIFHGWSQFHGFL